MQYLETKKRILLLERIFNYIYCRWQTFLWSGAFQFLDCQHTVHTLQPLFSPLFIMCFCLLFFLLDFRFVFLIVTLCLARWHYFYCIMCLSFILLSLIAWLVHPLDLFCFFYCGLVYLFYLLDVLCLAHWERRVFVTWMWYVRMYDSALLILMLHLPATLLNRQCLNDSR